MLMGGHVTGSFLGVACETSKGAVNTIHFSRSIDLAKLNLNCHMNYSIIFTEINCYPETSSLGPTIE